MAKQLFLNNFTSTFVAAVKDTPSSGTPATELDYGVLRLSDGAAGTLINPTGGDYYVLTGFKRSGSIESNIEVMRVTAVDNSTPGECRITVMRAQEGTSAKAFVSGDYVSLRMTKGTAETFLQPDDLASKEPVITAGTSAQYWRGDKSWSDFFTDVRATTLTGLSTATSAVIAAADTVLGALGKLQAQITGHTGASSGAHAATAISNTPAGNIAATTVQAAINELDSEKQATLVSGTNIKTAGGQNLVGSGDAPIVAPETHAATSKTTPVDADEIGLSDSAASWGLKKLTFSDLRTWLAGFFVGKTGAQSMTGDLTIPSLNGGQLAGMRNKIINGGFAVNQRGYVSGAATTAAQYTLDRWKVTGTGGVTFSTTNNKTTVTIPSGQTIQQVIEGLNLQTASYVLSWEGTAQGRIGGGSYGASGAVTASITGGTNTTIEFNAGTVANVQLEVGAKNTPYEHRSFAVELSLCQRYLPAYSGTGGYLGTGLASSGTLGYAVIPHGVQLRVAPTGVSVSSAGHFTVVNAAGSSVTCTSVALNSGGLFQSALTLEAASGFTASGPLLLAITNAAGQLLFTGCEL